MNILIIPKVFCKYKNQIEYSLEKNYYFFFKKVFPNVNIEIANGKFFQKKPNFLVLTGGNTIASFSKKIEDLERNNIDNFYYKYSIKNRLPIFGICHGAQFIAKKLGSKFEKSKDHTKNHEVFFLSKKLLVNSYHNLIIKNNSKKIDVVAIAKDQSVEAFKNLKIKVAGVIWHPERFTKAKKEDIKFIRNFYAACNISLRKRK